MKGFKFTTRFALIFSTTSLIAVGAIGYWLFVINLQALEILAQNRYQIIAHDVSSRLNEKIRTMRVLLMESNEIFSHHKFNNQNAQKLVISAFQRNASVGAIGFYNMEGRFVDAIAKGKYILPKRLPQNFIDTVALVANKPIIGRVRQFASDEQPMIPIALHFQHDDGSRGILACVLTSEDISAFIAEASTDAFGQKEKMYILDDSLRLIGSYDYATLMKRESYFGKSIFKALKSPSQIDFTRNVSAIREYINPAGKEMVGVYITLPEIRSVLVVEEPRELVYRSIDEVRRGVIVGLLAVMVVTIVMSFVVARQITRPIRQLLHASERIAAQDFAYRLNEKRGDEFAALFRSNNRVAAKLGQYSRDLEQKVAERTQELQTANEEISRQMEVQTEQAREIEIANTALTEKNLIIEQDRILLALERERSERLLLSVMPAPIAERMKAGETHIAEHFTGVTVLFADIVGFTKLSANVNPQELVGLLDTIFSALDELAAKHGLEKIKTIGDAYMVVGGVPVPTEDHCERVARFALEMQEILETVRLHWVLEGKELGASAVKMRVGIHTGEAVAGVIGTSKFAYDLWGDTVNTASRMESHGEAGKIHISNEVYRSLPQAMFVFEERGEIDVKGKGIMRTWFLTDII